MANADVIYAIAVQGAQEAVAEFNKVGTATKQVAEAQVGLADKANTYADAFKKVSRDIGTLGGQTAQAFTHAADEALSLVGIIGKGGLGAAISGAGLAVGALAFAWSAARDKADEYKKIADEALKKDKAEGVADSVKRIADEYNNAARAANNYDRATLQSELKAVERVLETKQSELFVARSAVDRERINSEIGDLEKRRDSVRGRLSDISDEEEQQFKMAEAEKQFATEKEARENAQRERERKWAEQERASDHADSQMRREDAEADRRQKEEENKRLDAIREDEEKKRKDAARQESEYAKDEEEAANRAADAFARAAIRKSDAADKAAAAIKKLRDEITNVGFAAQAFKNVTGPIFSAGMSVIETSTGLATKYLIDFGTVNRDNWRDMLRWSKDKQAAFAAEAQAALWSLARQAAPKAAYEFAEGIASFAGAASEGAKGNIPGAALHTAAGWGHLGASNLYMAIAGGGAVGALAIGASRGAGGPIPTAGGGRGAAPPVSGGGGAPSPSVGGGSRDSGGGGGSVNITYVYEAGSINAADERATARTVANGVGAARGSWFERRRMERRV